MTKPPPKRAKTRGPTAVPRWGANDDELEGVTQRAPRFERAESILDEQLVEITELPPIRRLAVAVHEAAGQLADAQRAVAAAGHAVAHAGSGRAGLETLAAAIAAEAVDVVLVAIPGGEPLIDAALALAPRRPVVVATCTGDPNDAVVRAAAAGADLVALRPHAEHRLAPILLAAARLHDERQIALSARGAESILRARLEALQAGEVGTLHPFELFQRVLELELRRARRYAYPLSVALFAVEVPPPPTPPGIRGILRARAGNALTHSIRDIDLATELDHERFLVLLPYTELAGAAEVGRRVVRAVAAQDPVVSSGRTYPPRVTGAIAGARTGQPLSFSRLMKDASRALEQARRDGAELAIQP